MAEKKFKDVTIKNFYMGFLLKKYSKEQILRAFEEAEKTQKDYIEYEIESLVKKQGFVTPEEQQDLVVEESDVWERVEGVIKDNISKATIVKEISKKRKKELNKIREKTETIEKVFNLDKDFLDCFNEFSFFNVDSGRNIFYVLLSALTKDINSIKFGNGVKNMLHYFIIQNSGTGKDRGFDFLDLLSKKINTYYKTTAEFKSKVAKGEAPDKLIRIYDASGSETMETYLDSYEVDHKGKLGDLIPGLFSSNDILILRECSFLFKGGSAEGKQSKRELFLQVMEGRSVEKSLIKWKGNSTHTYCNACIVGGTRPISNMKEHMANTGLQQRALNYMRYVDLDLRKKMLAKIAEKSMVTDEEIAALDKKYENLAKKLVEFREFYSASEFTFKNRQVLAKLINDRLLLMFEKIEKVLFHNEHKEILHTFMGRFVGLVNVISVFNAAIRFSKEVEEVDVDRSLVHIENNFNSTIDWVSEAITIDPLEEKKTDKWHKTIIKCFEKEQFIYRKDLVSKLILLMQASEPTVYRKLAQFKAMFKKGDKGLLSLVK